VPKGPYAAGPSPQFRSPYAANPESAKIAAKYAGSKPAEGSVVDYLVGATGGGAPDGRGLGLMTLAGRGTTFVGGKPNLEARAVASPGALC
jgi:hypothetical protein